MGKKVFILPYIVPISYLIWIVFLLILHVFYLTIFGDMCGKFSSMNINL